MIELNNRPGIDGRIFPLSHWGEFFEKRELGKQAMDIFKRLLGSYERGCR